YTFSSVLALCSNCDVIAIICSEVSSRKDLLSLGLASKKFLGPALDVLWKNMSSIKPLLCVLPEATLVNGKKVFLRPIAPSSWDRLHFYTSRVREFNEPRWINERTIPPSVYAYLGQGKPIFPRLRTLQLTHRSCNSSSFTLFLATSLQVVSWPCDLPRFSFESDSRSEFDLGSSLALLVSKSPGLKSLTLKSYTYSGLSLSLSCLRALENLNVMALSHLEMGFIQTVALLPRLTYLSLSLPAGIFLDYTGVEIGFPSLTKFQLKGSPLDLHKLLAALRPQALQDLTLHWEFEDVADPPLADFAAVTCILPSFPFLRRLRIVQQSRSFSPGDLDELQLWSIFEPLLELKRLEYLDYSTPLPLSDQNTARISHAWPHLEDLDLDLCSIGDLPPLQSLIHFARHCPKLKVLSYPIQLGATLSAVIQIPPTVLMHPLTHFWCDVEDDTMNATAIALGLHQIFPNLVQAGGAGDGWAEVEGILKSFIFLRNQNRQLQE
ncbi:hypothetical protein BDP27DRAFT_1331297, partial [Rhodocollybia butyracea]